MNALDAAEDFEDIQPLPKGYAPLIYPVMVRVGAIGKSGKLRLTVSLSPEICEQFSPQGWPRFSARYSKSSRTLAIAPQKQGPFEIQKAPKGSRHSLRLPPPLGSNFRKWPEALEAQHTMSSGTLYVRIPVVLEQPMLPPPPKTHKEIVEEAKKAFPVGGISRVGPPR